jgi:hypothetical protein
VLQLPPIFKCSGLRTNKFEKSVGAEESHPSAALALALQMCFGIEHNPKTSKCVMDVS